MFEIKNYPEFSWSMSRHKTLMECRRKYAIHYYISHNGWLYEAALGNKEAYRLKNITNMPIYFGEVVHEVIVNAIQGYLDGGRVAEEKQLIQVVRNKLNEVYKSSLHQKEEWFDRPKRVRMLHEIYYGGKLETETIEEIEERLSMCLGNFLRSESFQDILSKKEMYVVQAEQFKFMYVNNIKVYVVMDFVYRDVERNKWIIVDWKTGKEREDDRNQLALYAMYVMETFHVKMEDIIVRNEYLLTGTSREHKISGSDMENVEQILMMSVAQMLDYVDDVSVNKPISLEEFPKCIETYKCKKCNFIQMCYVGKEKKIDGV